MEEEEQTIRICRDCGNQIIWLPTNDGRSNRWGEPLHLPYNYPDKSFHRCDEYLERVGSQYRRMPNREKDGGIPCKVCGAPITFSEDQRSAHTGKMIPLEISGERHQHRSPQQTQQYGYSDRLQPERVFEQQGMPPEESEF